MDFDPTPGSGDHDSKVVLAARGIATAVAPETGLTAVQAGLLEAITDALNGVSVDYRTLEPLGPTELAEVMAESDLVFRQKMVHCMVLGEIVLRPIPRAVADRVSTYAEALGVEDEFVRIAHRYSEGMYGVAWRDLQRSGFVTRSSHDDLEVDRGAEGRDPFEPGYVDSELASTWLAFGDFPEGTLGRSIRTMYDERGFPLPGTPGGAPRYLAQHDFVHVLADYGTNLKGELEVFAFIARADPDPNGFAWLATVIGLFETGYIASTGFFDSDVREHNIEAPGMQQRVADAIRRGNIVCERSSINLFDVDYYALTHRDLEDVRQLLGVVPKSADALERGSAGLFDLAGMSERQRQIFEAQRAQSGINADG